jgi:DNA-binding HxlR family transcriptional regulator
VRSYDDPCGIARALDAVGERWAMLVVRELLFGPKRFTELSRGLPSMSQNVLSQRLRELEGNGIVRRGKVGPPASTLVYELTERGYGLEPVLLALAGWGSRLPLDSGAELSVDALMLALKSAFAPPAADGLQARYDLRLGVDRFHAEIVDGEFRVARGATDRPDATLDTDPTTLRSLVFGGRPIADAVRDGALRIAGDESAAARFVSCFPRPNRSADLSPPLVPPRPIRAPDTGAP